MGLQVCLITRDGSEQTEAWLLFNPDLTLSLYFSRTAMNSRRWKYTNFHSSGRAEEEPLSQASSGSKPETYLPCTGPDLIVLQLRLHFPCAVE